MDGFTYNNIFESKGIEYIAIIIFFLCLIPFWYFLNKPTKNQIKTVIRTLTANILKIPQGLFYSKNHTWSHLGKTGIASVGLDDLIPHIVGESKIKHIKKPGDMISKGDLLIELHNEDKILKIYSPISGEIMEVNNHLEYHPELLNDDPYNKGWILRVLPHNWINDVGEYYLSVEASTWMKEELNRFKDFLARKYSPGEQLVLQDGGELRNNVLSELSDDVWQDFQKDFLDL